MTNEIIARPKAGLVGFHGGPTPSNNIHHHQQ